MMKLRRLLLIIVAAVVVPLVGLGVYWAMQPRPKPGITRDNFVRIHRGMSIRQVDAILGSPGKPVAWESESPVDALVWEGEEGQLLLGFIGGKTVAGSFVMEGKPEDSLPFVLNDRVDGYWDWFRKGLGW